MKKVIRLTESDLTRIVRRVINEQEEFSEPNPEGTIRVTDPDGKERYEDTLKKYVIDMLRGDLDYFEKKTDVSGVELVNLLKKKLEVDVANFLREQEMKRYRTKD